MFDASCSLQKPSYTDQAKSWTAKVADNLHGQAEYLKNKVAGPSTTAVRSCMLCHNLRSLCSYGKSLHSIVNIETCL